MIFKLLLAIVVLSPLPFASVYPWSTSLLAVLVGLLLVAWQIECVVKGGSSRLGFRSIWPLVLLFAFVVGWAGLQTAPFVPEGWKAPIWGQASRALDIPLAGSVSINPEASATAIMGLLAYAGIFWLAFQYGRTSENARLAVRAVVISGFAYAMYGLWITVSDSRSILWFDKFAYIDDLTSTFVNRNSYATYAGLALLGTTGILVRILAGPLAKPFGRSERLRQLIDDVLEQSWLYLVIWVVIMTSIILSHSRAGFLSVVISLVVISVALGISKRVRLKYILLLCGLPVLMIGFLFFFSGAALNTRFGMLVSDKIYRPQVYQAIIDFILENPWPGTGYGTFAEAFQPLRTPEVPLVFLKAHSTYLENAMDLGLPAAVSLLAIFAGFLYLTFRAIRTRRHNVVYPAIGFSATILVMLHSLVDFSLQIPAVAVTYSLIIGIACSQSWSSSTPKDKW